MHTLGILYLIPHLPLLRSTVMLSMAASLMKLIYYLLFSCHILSYWLPTDARPDDAPMGFSSR